jgi:LDH2 family malate/lactate/ureidoglycolate dehydrogenase
LESVDTAGRVTLDELRRFGVSVLTARGWTAVQAGSIVAYHLWLDAAEVPESGIAALAGLLDSVAAGTIKPKESGRLSSERAAAVVLHAEFAAPVLVLARAGEIAAEKAREAGVGLVRVTGLKGAGLPTAPIVAEIAVGPYLGLALGPGPSWSVAVPTMGGLPAVIDTALGDGKGARRSKGQAALRDLLPAAGWMSGDESVIIGAVHTGLLDDGGRFQTLLDSWTDQPGLWLPEAYRRLRSAANQEGVALGPRALGRLKELAEACGVAPLSA